MQYTIKHLKGKTFVVHQHSLCTENLQSLPTTAYFSVLITKQEIFSGKTFVVGKNLQTVSPNIFFCIRYMAIVTILH